MKQVFLIAVIGLAVAVPARSQPLVVAHAARGSGTSAAQASPVAGTLASLVDQLDRNNPGLQVSRREIDMRVARVAPASAPPDPTVSVGYMGGIGRAFLSPTALGAFQQVGASQEIPYPGKLALKGRVASTEVDQTRWNYEDVRRRLIADRKLAGARESFGASVQRGWHQRRRADVTRGGQSWSS